MSASHLLTQSPSRWWWEEMDSSMPVMLIKCCAASVSTTPSQEVSDWTSLRCWQRAFSVSQCRDVLTESTLTQSESLCLQWKQLAQFSEQAIIKFIWMPNSWNALWLNTILQLSWLLNNILCNLKTWGGVRQKQYHTRQGKGKELKDTNSFPSALYQ